MTFSLDEARRMVPRWRESERSIALGELNSTAATITSSVSPEVLAEISLLVADFEEHAELGYATDLVSAASLVPRDSLPVAAKTAAKRVIERTNANSAASAIARRVLSGGSDLPSPRHPEPPRNRVRTLRASLRRYPLSPLSWIDLSRAHLESGSREKAARAMRAALGLAPEHRFVLRSFTRLALHLHRLTNDEMAEEAAHRLRRSSTTRRDPWLAAAEIACSMVLGHSPKSVRSARALLASDAPPFHLSELAASLGALEIDNGSIRAGTKLLSSALREPTDNSIAQVAWTGRRLRQDLLDPRFLDFEMTFEARAWQHFQVGNWRSAIAEAELWREDEPFASRPAQLATFAAMVPLADFALGERLARAGLLLNPDDTVTLNNLAFALASLDRPQEAREVLRKLVSADLKVEDRIAVVATSGLILFREGRPDEGRVHYRNAMELAHRSGDAEGHALASLYLAREENRIRSAKRADALSDASKAVKRAPRLYLQEVQKLIEIERT